MTQRRSCSPGIGQKTMRSSRKACRGKVPLRAPILRQLLHQAAHLAHVQAGVPSAAAAAIPRMLCFEVVHELRQAQARARKVLVPQLHLRARSGNGPSPHA